MSPLIAKYGLDNIPAEDRRPLAFELLEGEERPPMSEEIAAELRRRVEHSNNHPEDFIPAAEVHAAIRAKYEWPE